MLRIAKLRRKKYASLNSTVRSELRLKIKNRNFLLDDYNNIKTKRNTLNINHNVSTINQKGNMKETIMSDEFETLRREETIRKNEFMQIISPIMPNRKHSMLTISLRYNKEENIESVLDLENSFSNLSKIVDLKKKTIIRKVILSEDKMMTPLKKFLLSKNISEFKGKIGSARKISNSQNFFS